jgi:RimJ/RimL family protein N-acetyltransferase
MNNILIKLDGLEVRPFESSCAGNVAHWLSREPKETFLTTSSLPYPCTTEIFNSYYKTKDETGLHQFFSIYNTSKNRHIGHFEIKNISTSFEIGTIAHVILGDRDYRGKGNGKDIVRIIAKLGFEYLNLYRIGLSVYTFNTNAVAAYIKGGFVVEGVIREVIKRDEQRFSLYQMSIIRPEWESMVQDSKNLEH